jgi:hypothetical protein
MRPNSKTACFQAFQRLLCVCFRHQDYRLHMARHVHFDVRSSRLSLGTCPRFCRFTIPAPSGSVRQWELVYTLLPTLLYVRRLIPYRLNPDSLLNIGNRSKELYRLNPIALNSVAIRPPLPYAQSIKTLSLIQCLYVRLAQKPLDFWAFSNFGAPKERCPATL